MPRKRKPLAMQAGNITQMTQLRKKAEETSVLTGRNQLARPPEWLVDETARKEWKRVVRELKGIDLIGNLDKNNIGCYCNAFSDYIRITEELKQESFCVERETRTGTIIIKNPKIDLQQRYANEMRRFAGLCGLTIDSRLKVASAKLSKTEQQIHDEFGAI